MGVYLLPGACHGAFVERVAGHDPSMRPFRRGPPDTLPRWNARSLLPALAWTGTYRRASLGRNVFAGMVACPRSSSPAGIGYAEASGLPAIMRLYATIVPLLAYAALGPSRVLVLRPGTRRSCR